MTTTPISHGGGYLRAQSVSIQVSDRTKCTAGCQMCISRTTPGQDPVCGAIKLCSMRRLQVGLGFSARVGATHAILTGRADPTQEDAGYLCDLIRVARQHIPLVDMHTNAFLMQTGMPKSDLLGRLSEAGLTMLTLSVASFDDEINQRIMQIKRNPAELIPRALHEELLVRCSLVVTRSSVMTFEDVYQFILRAGQLGVHQVVVREIWIPEEPAIGVDRTVYEWNFANKVDIGPIQRFFEELAKCPSASRERKIRQIEPLPWGTPVFVVGHGMFSNLEHEVNVTFARCDEATTGSVIKSIVHRPDGHGYRNWDHMGDILY